jgi:hypothetical protein
VLLAQEPTPHRPAHHASRMSGPFSNRFRSRNRPSDQFPLFHFPKFCLICLNISEIH